MHDLKPLHSYNAYKCKLDIYAGNVPEVIKSRKQNLCTVIIACIVKMIKYLTFMDFSDLACIHYCMSEVSFLELTVISVSTTRMELLHFL